MSYLRCNSCQKFTNIPTAKYKIMGIGIVGFGIFGWFSFMFAGTGSALLIASIIVLVGIGISAEEMGKTALIKERCPQCQKVNWDNTPYKNKMNI